MFRYFRLLRFNYFILHFSLFALLLVINTFLIISQISAKNLLDLDIRAFYTAGFIVHKGVLANFYSFPTQYHWQAALFSPHTRTYLIPFLNPPFVALAFSPLSLFSPKDAYTILSFINDGILLICLYFLIKENHKMVYGNILFPLLAFAFFYLPILITIYLGQLSFFLLFSIVMSWYFFKREKPLFAGILLGLLLIKPHLLVLPFILLLWKRQWRAVLGLLLSTCVLLGISGSLVGIDGLKQYIQLLFTIPSFGEAFAVHPQLEPTLRGFLQVLFHTNMLSAVVLPLVLGYVLLMAFFFYVWRGNWDTKTAVFDLQWAIVVMILILTSIHTNYHDLTLLLFPYIMLLKCIHTKIRMYFMIACTDIILIALFPAPAFITIFNLTILVILMHNFYRFKSSKLAVANV